MKPRIIKSLDQWYILKQAIIEKGYKLHQFQYSWYDIEGFHARFWKDDKDVEVITHNKEIQADIISNGMT